MLNQLQSSDLVSIRNNFGGVPLFTAVQDACCDCCAVPQRFQFRPEHVFVEVATLLDELKAHPDDINWDRLVQQITQDYRFIDSTIPANELRCIAAIVGCTLASILVMEPSRRFNDIGLNLFQQVLTHDTDVPREALYALCDNMEEHEEMLMKWLEAYWSSEECLSNRFKTLFAVTEMRTDKDTPKHIRFVPTASTSLRLEFLDTLRNVTNEKQNWGKAGQVKRILASYRDDKVIEMDGTEIEIYEDLRECWGYDQSSKTFYAANPKLGKT